MQNWIGSGYGGFVYDAPEEIRDYSVKGKYRIPMNMHIGNMGLAPAVGAAVTTGPPYRTGGNLDNKRIGIGGMPLRQHFVCDHCLAMLQRWMPARIALKLH